MMAISWIGARIDPEGFLEVHTAMCDGVRVTAQFSVEAVEDHGADACRAVAERKIAEAGGVPSTVRVTNADFAQRD